MTKELTSLLNDFRTRQKSELENISDLSEKCQEACHKIERSWSGSFAGWHGRMYFRDFEAPSIYERFSGEWGGINGIPDGWEERQAEEVQARIQELVGGNFSTDKYEGDVKKLQKGAEALKKEIVIELSAFDFSLGLEKEKELFKRMEDFSFGNKKNEFIQNQLPKSLMSRDSEAIRQGTCIASWLYYEGVALAGRSACAAINDFLDLSEQLVRQIERKEQANKATPLPHLLSGLHPEIYKKCRALYDSGSYPEAVEKGFKVVRDRLRKLTGYETGSEAFGKGKLHIRGASAQNVDEDFNEGVKFLAMAIDRFRNEKSHTSDAKIEDPNRAYEYLRLSSLAMSLLENSEIRP